MCFGYARGRGGGRKRERKYIIFLVSYLLDEFGSFSVCVCACVFERERKREMFTNYSYGGGHSLYIFLSLWSMHVPSLFGLLPTVLASETCIFVRYFYSEVHTRTHMLKNNQIFCLSILSKFVSNWLVSLLSNFFRFKSVKQSSDAITNIS